MNWRRRISRSCRPIHSPAGRSNTRVPATVSNCAHSSGPDRQTSLNGSCRVEAQFERSDVRTIRTLERLERFERPERFERLSERFGQAMKKKADVGDDADGLR